MVAACRATKVPVLQRDWFLHPLQVGVRLSRLLQGLTVSSMRVLAQMHLASWSDSARVKQHSSSKSAWQAWYWDPSSN